jgi:hypothetical protein
MAIWSQFFKKARRSDLLAGTSRQLQLTMDSPIAHANVKAHIIAFAIPTSVDITGLTVNRKA